MNLRKVLTFNGIYGITLPKLYSNALNLKRGDYVEVSLKNKDTLIIKRHGVEYRPITIND